ncbi:MAG: VanZ family protein, partial [Dehalococcoidia bacterium]|nr:VanZ family protein [Dehalococcoidia bacterium]
MPLFSSARERRLWLWTLAVVAAIFASLGVGGQLAETLRDLDALEEALSAGLFLLCMLLVGTT